MSTEADSLTKVYVIEQTLAKQNGHDNSTRQTGSDTLAMHESTGRQAIQGSMHL